MFAVLSGLLLSTLIALPRIWLDSIKLPTKLASTSELTQGESHPSPKSDLVPTSAFISPFSNSAPTKLTFSLFPPEKTYSQYSPPASGLTVNLAPAALRLSAHPAGKSTSPPESAPIGISQLLLSVSKTLTMLMPSNFLSVPTLTSSSRLIKSVKTNSLSLSPEFRLSHAAISAMLFSFPADAASARVSLSLFSSVIFPRSQSPRFLKISTISSRSRSKISFSSAIIKFSAV